MKDAGLVSDLLEHVGGNIEPMKLIKAIPPGMEIINLKDKLVKIISDFRVQVALSEGCTNVLRADCVALMQQLVRRRQRPFRV